MITISDRTDLPPERLSAQLVDDLAAAEGALLWSARRPRKRWYEGLTDHRPLVLSSAPRFEQILWLPPDVEIPPAPDFECEQRVLLEAYAELFLSGGEVERCPLWQRYRDVLLAHIEREESTTYPLLLQALPIERAVRELRYEHLGLQRGLETLPDLIRRARGGELGRREREKLDIDFYHLLEHHLERESQALYPALSFLKRKKGLQSWSDLL